MSISPHILVSSTQHNCCLTQPTGSHARGIVPGACLQESLSMIAFASKGQRSAPLAAYDVLINISGNSAQEQEKELSNA
jgi:hypothetical protein